MQEILLEIFFKKLSNLSCVGSPERPEGILFGSNERDVYEKSVYFLRKKYWRWWEEDTDDQTDGHQSAYNIVVFSSKCAKNWGKKM